MKYVVILALCMIYATHAAKIKCMVGKSGAEKETECASEEEKTCSQPLFVEFTGLSADVEYKCGACATGTKDKTCSECTGAATACNKAKELGADFMCHKYTYNSTSKAFTVHKDTSTCKRLKATGISCNSPKKDATDKTYTSTTGCGNCTKTDTHCETCTKAKCNSGAMRVAVLFAPLLAVLVHLF